MHKRVKFYNILTYLVLYSFKWLGAGQGYIAIDGLSGHHRATITRPDVRIDWNATNIIPRNIGRSNPGHISRHKSGGNSGLEQRYLPFGTSAQGRE